MGGSAENGRSVPQGVYRVHALAKIEADEREIISLCQTPGFTAQKLKDLYAKIRPGTY